MKKRGKKQASKQPASQRPHLRRIQIFLDIAEHAEMIRHFDNFVKDSKAHSESAAGRMLFAKALTGDQNGQQ